MFNPLGFLVVTILVRRILVLCIGEHPVGEVLNSDQVGISLFSMFLLVGVLRGIGLL